MSKIFKVGIVGLLVVGALTVVMAGSALAQEPTPPDPSDRPFGLGRGGFGWFGGDRWAMFDAMAEALGLTPEELFTELHSGKTLAEVAEAQGVDTETLRSAVEATRIEAAQQAIQQALEDGTISQEKADWMLEGLENGYWGGRGFRGHGFGKPGGFRGIGGFHGPPDSDSLDVSGIDL